MVRAGLTSGSEACVRAVASSDAIGGEVSARRPSQIPIKPAATHQPAENGTRRSSLLPVAPATVSAAKTVAAPALARTVVRRKSVNRTGWASVCGERREQLGHPGRAVDHDVGLIGDFGRSLVRADA